MKTIHSFGTRYRWSGIANPISVILSVTMMLRESFNETERAGMTENAVDKDLESRHLDT